MIVTTNQGTATLDFAKVDIVDAEAIEDVFGVTFDEWMTRTVGADKTPGSKDLRAFIFLARRQSGEPDLAWADVRFEIGSLDVTYTPEEQAVLDKEKAIAEQATGADGVVDPTLPDSSATASDLEVPAEIPVS